MGAGGMELLAAGSAPALRARLVQVQAVGRASGFSVKISSLALSPCLRTAVLLAACQPIHPSLPSQAWLMDRTKLRSAGRRVAVPDGCPGGFAG